MVQDDSRAALTDAVDVKTVAAHVHQLSGRRISTLVYLRGDELVECPRDGQHEEGADRPQQRLAYPPHDPSGHAAPTTLQASSRPAGPYASLCSRPQEHDAIATSPAHRELAREGATSENAVNAKFAEFLFYALR